MLGRSVAWAGWAPRPPRALMQEKRCIWLGSFAMKSNKLIDSMFHAGDTAGSAHGVTRKGTRAR